MNTSFNTYELKTAGIMLALGSLITIICICLEVNANWNSFIEEKYWTDIEAGKFLFENWSEMSAIWTLALVGNIFLALAAILFVKNINSESLLPISLLWAIYFIGSLILILAFGISVGSYYPALEVLDQSPSLFKAVRGAPLFLFNFGMTFGLIPIFLFVHSGFTSQGIVPKRLAIFTLSVVGLFMIGLFAGVISFTSFAISTFLPPLALGYSYWRHS